MKYIDLPPPKTAREIFTEWMDGIECNVSWAVTWNEDSKGEDENFTSLVIENQHGGQITFERYGSDVIRYTNLDLIIGMFEIFMRGTIHHDYGNKFWKMVRCYSEDVVDMLSNDKFLELFDANEWPSELSEALGKK